MNGPAPLLDMFVPAKRTVTVTCHQPSDRGSPIKRTGRLLGAMYAGGRMHHVRVALDGGVVLLAPPAWVARESRCRLVQAGLMVPHEWDDGSLFVPLIDELAAAWGADLDAPETVA